MHSLNYDFSIPQTIMKVSSEGEKLAKMGPALQSLWPQVFTRTDAIVGLEFNLVSWGSEMDCCQMNSQG